MARSRENARVETAYTGARHVLDAQREARSDIDSKAMYTVRVVVVIVGVIVAAVRIGGTSIVPGPLLVGGLSFLLPSTAFGVLTYTESNLFVGPNRRQIRRLVERNGEDPRWEADLCLQMGDWIDDNHDDLRVNARLLLLAQVPLLAGVTLIAGGVAL